MRRRRVTMLGLLVAALLVAFALAGCAPGEDGEQQAATQPAEADAPDDDADDPEPSDEVDADEVPREPADAAGVDDPDPAEDAADDATDVTVTAYVVAYHWGFAIFDEDGSELEELAAPKGATVELIAVNDHAHDAIAQLPDPVAEGITEIDWHARAHDDFSEGQLPDPEEQVGESVSAVLAAAHDGHDHHGPVDDHGLTVEGAGDAVFLDAHGDEPKRLAFTVDSEGEHELICTQDCGYGHPHHRGTLLQVEG